MNRNIANMRKMELKLLIIEYNKASLLDRSFAKTELSSTKKIEFRKKLLEYCIFLMEKIDNETLENSDIREKIRELTRIDVNNISFGQAQKVVNVTLKQYCFIMNKENLFKKLDCPLDTITMKDNKISHKKMIDVTEEDYLKYQDIFYEQFNGTRILKDWDYDEQRIHNFLNPEPNARQFD